VERVEVRIEGEGSERGERRVDREDEVGGNTGDTEVEGAKV
jgi:hypothetical protein